MKILHLFSNWKWTGPAEHALQLAQRLSLRGHQVLFAYGRPPKEDLEGIRQKAQALGVKTIELELEKHLHLFANMKDLWELRSILKDFKPELIHTHLANDHLLGGVAARLFYPSAKVLRTSYEGEGLEPSLRNKMLLRYFTSGLVTVSEKGRERCINLFSLPPERIWKVEVGVDTNRFNPQKYSRDASPPKADTALRRSLGIGPSEVVVGIVARIQRHRRFDVFLEAFRQASSQMPNLRAMLIGRGTHMHPVAVEPTRRMGLNGRVLFPGYKEGEEYVEALASMDIKVFLVPGTDGSCRAVREAMAMGIPVIVARRGMLPEMVKEGKVGFVIEDNPENLSEVILTLARNETLRRNMGQAAREWALEHFSLDREVDKVEAIYNTLAS
ncbi:MAG TPA: glycosyltransferase family 4 protein [Candidatus Hypogeohydataceae bacterium YC41]